MSNHQEPLAPASFYSLPRWAVHKCKDVIIAAEHLQMTIQKSKSSKGKWRASIPKGWFAKRVTYFQYGDDMLEAIMRCIVVSRFGKTIGVEDDIYDALMKL